MGPETLHKEWQSVKLLIEKLEKSCACDVDDVPVNSGCADGNRKDRYDQINAVSNPPLEQHKVFAHCIPPTTPHYGKLSVFTAGSIDMGATIQWQQLFPSHLNDLPARRGNWDPRATWKCEDPAFRTQVELELDALTPQTLLAYLSNESYETPRTVFGLPKTTSSNTLEVENNKSAFAPGQLAQPEDLKVIEAYIAACRRRRLQEGIRVNKTISASECRLSLCKDKSAEGYILPEPSFTQSGIVPSKASATLLRQLTASSPPSLLLSSLFFAPTYAHPITGTQTSHERGWQQRARGALQDNLVTLAFLLLPTIVLGTLGSVAYLFHRNKQQGYVFFSMLGTAVVFVAISKAADAEASGNSSYMRMAVGVAYSFFMASFCRLIAARQKWHKGRCAIAGGIAILLTMVGMAVPDIKACWMEATKLDPLLAVLVGLPMAFAVCDLAVYVAREIGGGGVVVDVAGGEEGVELVQGDDQGGRDQVTLPLPVPGPHRT